MRVLSIIPARGGSKGIPKKNMAPLDGKPLIFFTIQASLASKYINRTIVSSDDLKTLTVAKKYGAEIVRRPNKISRDDSLYQLLIIHSLDYIRKKDGYRPDIIVYLQPTSPLRTGSDIDKAMNLMLAKKAPALISVCALDKKFLKIFRVDNLGYLKGVVNDDYPFANRQNLPDVFMPNGAIFAIKTDIFLKRKQLFAPKTIPYIMSAERSIDIDTLDDLKRAEKFLKKD